MNGPATAAEFFPGFDLATEEACQLLGIELVQRVLRVKDNGQAVDGDDLLGGRAFQITQGSEVNQLAVLDRAR